MKFLLERIEGNRQQGTEPIYRSAPALFAAAVQFRLEQRIVQAPTSDGDPIYAHRLRSRRVRFALKKTIDCILLLDGQAV